MRVTVNGRECEVPDGLTVLALVEHFDLASGPVAVEVNRDIIVRSSHANHVVHPGDIIEIVHFVGGG
jgi:sulfur carrier protein